MQVRGELCAVVGTSVLSVLGTLLAVRWLGTPLRVKFTCAEAPAAGLTLAPAPGLYAADAPIFGAGHPRLPNHPRVQVRWSVEPLLRAHMN